MLPFQVLPTLTFLPGRAPDADFTAAAQRNVGQPSVVGLLS
jgi:hypothetical protein